jgi:hypothetical protein
MGKGAYFRKRFRIAAETRAPLKRAPHKEFLCNNQFAYEIDKYLIHERVIVITQHNAKWIDSVRIYPQTSVQLQW